MLCSWTRQKTLNSQTALTQQHLFLYQQTVIPNKTARGFPLDVLACHRRGSRNTPSHLMLWKPGQAGSGMMGHLARTQTLPLHYSKWPFHVKGLFLTSFCWESVVRVYFYIYILFLSIFLGSLCPQQCPFDHYCDEISGNCLCNQKDKNPALCHLSELSDVFSFLFYSNRAVCIRKQDELCNCLEDI